LAILMAERVGFEPTVA